MSDPDPLQALRDEVTALGLRELRSAAEVDRALGASGSVLLLVHSVCAVSAEVVRPALARWLAGTDARPDHLFAVLAGADPEAVARARLALRPHRPSAPQIALLSNGRLLHLFQRADLAGREPEAVARALEEALTAAT
jgi:putative YphP/YqiW family bacilliredoxin